MKPNLRRILQRFPQYLSVWFFCIITVSVFTPITLADTVKSLMIVFVIFLICNFKLLINAR